MDGKPPLESVSSRTIFAIVLAVLFVLMLLWGLNVGREDARNVSPEERALGEPVR